jgi:type IV secretion system protein VirB1
MLTGIALASAISSCVPTASDKPLLAKIIAHESGGSEFAINDNDAHRSYFPQDLATAQGLLVRLRRHNLDAGLMQVNVRNWPALGLTEATVFDRCANIGAGATVFAYFYERAVRAGLAGYNTGDIYSQVGARYADLVLDRTIEPPSPPRGVDRTPRSHPKPPSADAAPSAPSGPLAAPSVLGPQRSSSF